MDSQEIRKKLLNDYKMALLWEEMLVTTCKAMIEAKQAPIRKLKNQISLLEAEIKANE